MKILKRIILTLILFIIAAYTIVFLGHKVFFKYPYSSTPTVESLGNKGFEFGVTTKKQPTTIEGYVKVVAQQMKHFNANFDNYWPDNPAVNQYLIVQASGKDSAYLITPKGEINNLTKEQFNKYNIPTTLNTGSQWAPFEAQGISGAYIKVPVESLTNYYEFQKYYHLGSYDQFLSYSHELFHSMTQVNFADNSFGNKERDPRLQDTKARKTRMLLMQQLAKAISEPSDRELYIKKAISTYKQYKEKSKEDYENSLLYDRLEGTAYYYELVSSLYAGYPEQIKTQEDVYRALEIILANDNPAYRTTSVDGEAYNIGGYAGILLDLQAIEKGDNPEKWKKDLIKDGELTPMIILERQNSDNLPEPQAIPTDKEYEEWLAGKDKVTPSPTKVAVIFNLLYSIMFFF